MQASIDGELTEMEQAIESLIYDADSLNVILAHVQSKEENKAGNRTLKGEA